MRKHVITLLSLLLAAPALAQTQRHFTDAVDQRFTQSTPVIHYLLTVSDRDTTAFDVRMTVRNAPDTFRIAMAKHPEYDDRFFRYIENLRSDATVTISQEDSVLWRVVAPHGETVVIQYRIALPPSISPHAAWRPFLSPTGGLTGGPHTFMYVVGAEQAPAHVEVRMPAAWSIATGLTPTLEPRTFFAANAYVLVESPILVGRFRTWGFQVDGVPHTVAYSPSPKGVQFDTATFRNGVERLVNEAVKLFGRAPYREYIFQFQDDSWGALEHHNSVSLSASSSELAKNPHAYLPETAHEFFHTWNLMRIRPAEYVGVTYQQIQPVPTLWFSEGLTLFYADLLVRRAGLPTSDSTRIAHLTGIIARYLANPSHARFSAEQVSRVAYNAPPDALGDYSASAHLYGEVLGAVLDLMVRDATNGKKSMDDVMRLMLERGSGPRGFGTADIERAVADACTCVAKPFFDAHVRGAQPVDFNRYLALIGLHAEITSEPVMREGQPVPDQRLWGWNPPGDSLMSLLINNPTTVWGKAGLHSGERVITVNGITVRTWPELRQILAGTQIGDNVHFVVKSRRALEPRTVTVKVTGYNRPVVQLEEIFTATEKQIRLREAWLKGTS